MNILILGDIVGNIGCDFLSDNLTKFKEENNIAIVIANGENSAEGNGISQKSAKSIFSSGVDIITTGNHVFKQPDYYLLFENYQNVIRPANFHKDAPGDGYCYFNYNNIKICIINIIGTTYMQPAFNPFDCIDSLLSSIKADIIIVDIHAEATAEKLCFAHYIDSKVTAVVGTHTHIQTADEQILPLGTSYITDLGMVGPINSILGIQIDKAINKMRTGLPSRFKNAIGKCKMDGIILTIDDVSFKATKITRISLK